MMVDREMRFIAANDAYLKLTATPREALLGRGLFERFPHDPDEPENANAALLRASITRVFERAEPEVLAHIEYRVPIETPHGVEDRVRVWSASHTPVCDDDGTVRYVLQRTADVTDAERASAATLVANARLVQEANTQLLGEQRVLHRVFAQAPGFMFHLDADSLRITLANARFLALVGRADVTGSTLAEAAPWLAEHPFGHLAREALATGETRVGDALRVTPTGAARGPLWLDTVFQPIVDGAGRVTGVVVQGYDITARRALEEEREALLQRERDARAAAERANAEKSLLLANVSHELRTPLTAMVGWISLLRGARIDGPQREHGLAVIDRNARSLARLIDDLLDITSNESRRIALSPEPLDLGALAASVVDSLAPVIRESAIPVRTSWGPGCVVHGDVERLQQVVWNLLTNALRYTPRGGRIEVSVTRDAETISLRVGDTGRGLTRDELSQVFNRFWRADGESGRSGGGLGIGLAIVRSIVDLHGGRVTVESDGPLRGSTFTVTLPAARDASDARDTHAAAPDACPIDLAGMRVLVVDDDADTRELMEMLLTLHGAEVSSVSSGPDALAALRTRRVDVLLSDVAMPGMDGLSLVRTLRAAGDATPAIAVTAYTQTGDHASTRDAGFTAHVAKPIDPPHLLALLARIRSDGSSSAPTQ